MPPPPSTHPPTGRGRIERRGILIAAPASGQGKTTVTLGLLRALVRRGVDVTSAKSGPDYIDPAFHAAATGRPCLTLDSWAMLPGEVRARAAEHAGSVLIVEGAMGLFDGAVSAGPGGPGSAAALADALGLGVLLVVDAARMGQSVGALVHGFAAQYPGIGGVLLNRVGSARHGIMLAGAIRDVPVLGCLPRDAKLVTPSRHLGLVQAAERGDLDEFIDRAADWVECHVDLEAILAVARPCITKEGVITPLPPPGQRIAVAQDRSFGFSYHHMLLDWRRAGAEIVPFSPLADQAPDSMADAVFLPGGYPELHAGVLAGAGTFRAGVCAAAARGAQVMGECGGFMVLGQGIVDADGARHAMLGLLGLETSFAERRLHLGYRKLSSRAGPWPARVNGHEFHYAVTLEAEGEPLFDAADAAGQSLGAIGLVSGTVSGSFAHVITVA